MRSKEVTNSSRFLGYLALAIGLAGTASADTIRNAGVLGNSGEAGSNLVKFAPGNSAGMGVAYDKFGSLWDRGGPGRLNRYALDGRLLGSYVLPNDQPNRNADQIVTLGDKLLIRLARGLYSLSIDAPSGTAATPLNVAADMLSPSGANGWAAALVKGEVLLVNSAGETKSLGSPGGTIRAIEMGSDGTVYVSDYNTVSKIVPGTPPTRESVGPNPGERPQLVDGFWFGNAWHSTIRRFDSHLKAAPGVVLGGNSGSFIGHVDEQAEVVNARGLAKISADLYGASGIGGILHLLQWSEAEQRFNPIRRIGAVTNCTALAMDKAGRIWHSMGNWEWDDAPTTPLHNGIPSDEVYGGDAMDDETVVFYGQKNGQPTLYFGKPTKELRLQTATPTAGMPKTAVAVALTGLKKRRALLILQKDGTAQGVFVNSDGSFGGDAGSVKLETVAATKSWSGLAAIGTDKLIAAGDGFLIEFARDGDGWRETNRYNSWGEGAGDKLGDTLEIAASGNRLWVSDTKRQRVLCFDTTSKKPLGQFGLTDEPGDDLTHLSTPGTITANGTKAAVYDAGNQRIVRLELVP